LLKFDTSLIDDVGAAPQQKEQRGALDACSGRGGKFTEEAAYVLAPWR
jgi:hypothetical protein